MSDLCESAAAYVLGALPAGERAAYEEHLSTCADCRQTVADLAGIPGLLSRVSPDDLVGPAPVPVPDTLVPRLVRAVRRAAWRRRLVMAGLAAAAVILAVAGTALVVGSRNADQPVGVPMTAVVDSPVTASARLVAHRWGTEVTMVCRYSDRTEWSRPYELVAVDDQGRSYSIATWVVGPGKTASIRGSVPVRPEHLDRLEIRATTSGAPLLRLNP